MTLAFKRLALLLMLAIGVLAISFAVPAVWAQHLDSTLSSPPATPTHPSKAAERSSGPIAKIKPDHLEVRQGEKAHFENVSIYDPDSHLKRVEWKGPGGQKGRDSAFEVRTDTLSPGTYKVTLSITDSRGQSSSTTASLKVTPPSPEMRIPSRRPGVEGHPEVVPPPRLTVEIDPPYQRIEQGGRATYRSRVVTGPNHRLVSQVWKGPGGQKGRGDSFEVRTDNLRPGTHKVMLSITDSRGQSATAKATLEVEAHPPESKPPIVTPGLLVPPESTVVPERDRRYAASISAEPQSVEKGEAVNFTAFITPSVRDAEFMFAFGDGASSGWISGPRAIHAYASPGTHYAFVSVRERGRIIAESPKVPVLVTEPAPMKVRLTSDKDRVEPREGVAFQVITQPHYRDAEYLFSFGDGLTSGWTRGPTIEHAYSEEGVYKAFVAVRVKGEQRGESPSIALEVKKTPHKPAAKITPEHLKVTQGERALYQSLSNPKGRIRERWKGPGNQTASGSSFEMPTDHLAPGRHDVFLEVTDESGQQDGARAVLEVVARTEYRVDLRVNPSATEPGRSVRFDAVLIPLAQGAEFRFTFGDGTGTQWSRDSGVQHTYVSSGMFRAEVVARIGDRTIGSAPAEVRVGAPPQALRVLLHADRSRVSTGEKVHFTVASEPPVQGAEYLYNFGDSSTSGWTGQAGIDHPYRREGTYRAIVTVRLADGRLIASETVSINVTGGTEGLTGPVAKITPEYLSVVQGERAAFESQSAPRWSIREDWHGPAGQAGRGRRFQILTEGLSPGQHEIVLTVTDNRGMTEEASAILTVVPVVRDIVFEVQPNPVESGKTANFSARTEPHIEGIEYRFVFGDETADEWSPSAGARHVYTKPGTYHASVSARLGGQAMAQSISVTVTVVPPPIVPPPVDIWPWIIGAIVAVLGGGYYFLSKLKGPWKTAEPKIDVRPHIDTGIQQIESDVPVIVGSAVRLRPVLDPGKQDIESKGSLHVDEGGKHG